MLKRILFVALLVGVSTIGMHTASDAGKGKDKFIQKRQEREKNREKKERDKQQESEQELEGNEGDEHKSTGENCLIPPAPEPEQTPESK